MVPESNLDQLRGARVLLMEDNELNQEVALGSARARAHVHRRGGKWRR